MCFGEVERVVFDTVGSSVMSFLNIEWFHSHDGYQINYLKDTDNVTGLVVFFFKLYPALILTDNVCP